MLVSIVVPVYNEAQVLPIFIESLSEAIKNWPEKTEVIFVDDGSTDETKKIIKSYIDKIHFNFKIRLVSLYRNYGQAIALAAGLDSAKGDIILTIDGDMEFDPNILTAFKEKIIEGFDMASGVRISKETSMLRKACSFFINLLGRYITGLRLKDLSCPVNGFSRSLVETIRGGQELSFLKIRVARFAKKIAEIEIAQRSRPKGRSKYDFIRLFSLFIEFIISYLRNVFQYIMVFGLFTILLSFLSGLLYLFLRIIGLIPPSAILQVIVFLAFFTGWQSVILGFLGEYLLRIRSLLSERPVYKIREVIDSEEWNFYS